MKITIIVEGKTEQAFMPHLREFLKPRLLQRMPRLDTLPYDGRIPKGERLRRLVGNLLQGRDSSDHVIALTDVYTGTNPPDFVDARDAKRQMHKWVGINDRFHPHTAQHDFEAWLIPYWETIQRLAGHNRQAPAGDPELVNHNRPPAHRIQEIFRTGQRGRRYVKPRDAGRMLRDNDLSVSIDVCSELKAFVNTIVSLCGGTVIP